MRYDAKWRLYTFLPYNALCSRSVARAGTERESRGVRVEPRHDTEDLRAAAAPRFPQEGGGEAREKAQRRRGDLLGGWASEREGNGRV